MSCAPRVLNLNLVCTNVWGSWGLKHICACLFELSFRQRCTGLLSGGFWISPRLSVEPKLRCCENDIVSAATGIGPALWLTWVFVELEAICSMLKSIPRICRQLHGFVLINLGLLPICINAKGRSFKKWNNVLVFAVSQTLVEHFEM